MVDWGELEKKVEANSGPIRGKYWLTREDSKRLVKLLKKHEGRILLATSDALEIFYVGKGSPNAQSVVTALNRNFGDTFRFATRERGAKVAVELKE